MQFGVCERAAFVRVISLPNQRDVAAVAVVHVAVHTVEAGVEFAADEPLDFRLVVIRLAQSVPFLEPMQPFRLFRPEALGVVDRAIVQLAVLFERGNVCVGRGLGGGRVNLGLGIVAHGSNRVGQFMKAKRRVNAGACDRRTGRPWADGSALSSLRLRPSRRTAGFSFFQPSPRRPGRG